MLVSQKINKSVKTESETGSLKTAGENAIPSLTVCALVREKRNHCICKCRLCHLSSKKEAGELVRYLC